MIITDISEQKKKGRYNLFVDGEFFSGIDAFAVVHHGLKVGLEIDQDRIEELVFESETRSCFDKVINILSVPRSRKEIIDKLKKYSYSQRVVDASIRKAEEYGYINDKDYAKMLVSSKKLKSKLEIKKSLFEKGISSSIASAELEKIDEEEEKARALVLSEKYLKNKQIDKKTLSGLYAFLLRKGFGTEVAMHALRKFKSEEIEDYGGD